MFRDCVEYHLPVSPPRHSFRRYVLAQNIKTAIPEYVFVDNRKFLVNVLSQSDVNAQ